MTHSMFADQRYVELATLALPNHLRRRSTYSVTVLMNFVTIRTPEVAVMKAYVVLFASMVFKRPKAFVSLFNFRSLDTFT